MTSLPIGELEASAELAAAAPRRQSQQPRRSSLLRLSLPPGEGPEGGKEDAAAEAELRRKQQREYARALDAQVAARRRQRLAGMAEGTGPLSPLSARRLAREEGGDGRVGDEGLDEPGVASPLLLPAGDDGAATAVPGRSRCKSEEQALYAAALREQMAEQAARRHREAQEGASEPAEEAECERSDGSGDGASTPVAAPLSQARRRLVHDVYGPQTSPWGSNGNGNGAGSSSSSYASPRLGSTPAIRAPPPTPASPAAALSAAAAAIEAEAEAGAGGAALKPPPSFARHGARALDPKLETALAARQRQAAEQRAFLEAQMAEKKAREARAQEERREEERRLLELLRRAEAAEAESHARRRRLERQAAAVVAAAAAMAPVALEEEEDEGNPAPTREAQELDGMLLAGGSSLEANSKFLAGGFEAVAAGVDGHGSRALFPPIHPAALSTATTTTTVDMGMQLEEEAEEEELMGVGTSTALPFPIPAAAARPRTAAACYEEGPFEGSLPSESTLLYLSSEEKRRMDAELRRAQQYWRERLQGRGGLGASQGSNSSSRGNGNGTSRVAALSPAAQVLVREADALLRHAEPGPGGEAAAPMVPAEGGGDDMASIFELSGLSLGSLPDLLRRLGNGSGAGAGAGTGTGGLQVQEEEAEDVSPLRDISNRPAAAPAGAGAGSGAGKATTTAALAALLQAERRGMGANA